MYYVIEKRYMGSDKDFCDDEDTIEISTEPAWTTQRVPVCICGYCGMANDFVIFAHGQYATLEAAQRAISVLFGEVRDMDSEDEAESDVFKSDNESVVKVYKHGKFRRFSFETTADCLSQEYYDVMNAFTSDEQLATWSIEAEANANASGTTYAGQAMAALVWIRQQLRDFMKTNTDYYLYLLEMPNGIRHWLALDKPGAKFLGEAILGEYGPGIVGFSGYATPEKAASAIADAHGINLDAPETWPAATD